MGIPEIVLVKSCADQQMQIYKLTVQLSKIAVELASAPTRTSNSPLMVEIDGKEHDTQYLN